MKEIIQYLYNPKNREKKGVVIALTQEGSNKFAVGVSVTKSVDKFNKELGKTIARGRAIESLENGNSVFVPASVLENVAFFSNRAKLYFKDRQLGHDFYSSWKNKIGTKISGKTAITAK